MAVLCQVVEADNGMKTRVIFEHRTATLPYGSKSDFSSIAQYTFYLAYLSRCNRYLHSTQQRYIPRGLSPPLASLLCIPAAKSKSFQLSWQQRQHEVKEKEQFETGQGKRYQAGKQAPTDASRKPNPHSVAIDKGRHTSRARLSGVPTAESCAVIVSSVEEF